jgi:site-specific DNA recombinase
MKIYFAYIRVSTAKQGEQGASLDAQQAAIERYAEKHGLMVGQWFEEQETAAKRGRAVFRQMMGQLKKGKAHGVIIHKVDRSARNLSDWAELAALMDSGVDVHFAHEALDLSSRGGRLSADIQAVVAADFIRNLRDEVKKGIYGRLAQGHYPFKAPPGYRNNGRGALKTKDPVTGPIIREAFKRYATGKHTLRTIQSYLYAHNVRTYAGKPLSLAKISKILASPFYYGLITVKGQTFEGVHEALIDKALFDRVRSHAGARCYRRPRPAPGHSFRFRGQVKCFGCGRTCYPEKQKGHVYYRCHNSDCKGTCVNEANFAAALWPLTYLPLAPSLSNLVTEHFDERITALKHSYEEAEAQRGLQLANLAATERRITDLLIDGTIDRATFQERKREIVERRLILSRGAEKLRQIEELSAKRDEFLELVLSLRHIAETPNVRELPVILDSAVSNFLIYRKSVEIAWSKPLEALLDTAGFPVGEHFRNEFRK